MGEGAPRYMAPLLAVVVVAWLCTAGGWYLSSLPNCVNEPGGGPSSSPVARSASASAARGSGSSDPPAAHGAYKAPSRGAPEVRATLLDTRARLCSLARGGRGDQQSGGDDDAELRRASAASPTRLLVFRVGGGQLNNQKASFVHAHCLARQLNRTLVFDAWQENQPSGERLPLAFGSLYDEAAFERRTCGQYPWVTASTADLYQRRVGGRDPRRPMGPEVYVDTTKAPATDVHRRSPFHQREDEPRARAFRAAPGGTLWSLFATSAAAGATILRVADMLQWSDACMYDELVLLHGAMVPPRFIRADVDAWIERELGGRGRYVGVHLRSDEAWSSSARCGVTGQDIVDHMHRVLGADGAGAAALGAAGAGASGSGGRGTEITLFLASDGHSKAKEEAVTRAWPGVRVVRFGADGAPWADVAAVSGTLYVAGVLDSYVLANAGEIFTMEGSSFSRSASLAHEAWTGRPAHFYCTMPRAVT